MAEAAKSLTAEDLVRDVRAGRVSPVYYLMGAEEYYINEISEFLTNTLLKPEERDFNLDIVYGADTNAAQIVELAQAYPMMADRRVVLVREAQSLSSLDALEHYLKHPASPPYSSSATSMECWTRGRVWPKACRQRAWCLKAKDPRKTRCRHSSFAISSDVDWK